MRMIIAALLLGCAGVDHERVPAPTPVQDATQLAGSWCDGDLCLKVTPTNYGEHWLIYSWESLECREGGFIQVDSSGQFLFGAIDFGMNGCFSKLSPDRYTASFQLEQDNKLMAKLSVLDHELLLVKQQGTP